MGAVKKNRVDELEPLAIPLGGVALNEPKAGGELTTSETDAEQVAAEIIYAVRVKVYVSPAVNALGKNWSGNETPDKSDDAPVNTRRSGIVRIDFNDEYPVTFQKAVTEVAEERAKSAAMTPVTCNASTGLNLVIEVDMPTVGVFPVVPITRTDLESVLRETSVEVHLTEN